MLRGYVNHPQGFKVYACLYGKYKNRNEADKVAQSIDSGFVLSVGCGNIIMYEVYLVIPENKYPVS